MSNNKTDTGRRNFVKLALSTAIGTGLGAAAGGVKSVFFEPEVDISALNLPEETAQLLTKSIRDRMAKNTIKEATLGGLIVGAGAGVGAIILDNDSTEPS